MTENSTILGRVTDIPYVPDIMSFSMMRISRRLGTPTQSLNRLSADSQHRASIQIVMIAGRSPRAEKICKCPSLQAVRSGSPYKIRHQE
jgi:hypothetical protein